MVSRGDGGQPESRFWEGGCWSTVMKAAALSRREALGEDAAREIRPEHDAPERNSSPTALPTSGPALEARWPARPRHYPGTERRRLACRRRGHSRPTWSSSATPWP